MRYDADKAPDPDQWLELDEHDRIDDWLHAGPRRLGSRSGAISIAFAGAGVGQFRPR